MRSLKRVPHALFARVAYPGGQSAHSRRRQRSYSTRIPVTVRPPARRAGGTGCSTVSRSTSKTAPQTLPHRMVVRVERAVDRATAHRRPRRAGTAPRDERFERLVDGRERERTGAPSKGPQHVLRAWVGSVVLEKTEDSEPRPVTLRPAALSFSACRIGAGGNVVSDIFRLS